MKGRGADKRLVRSESALRLLTGGIGVENEFSDLLVSLREYERLQRYRDPALMALARVFDQIEQDICPECGLSDQCPAIEKIGPGEEKDPVIKLNKGRCPAVLSMIDGINGRLLDTKSIRPWVGIGLDGVLSEIISYDQEWDDEKIGKPIEPMIQVVKSLIASNIDVRIFTFRVALSNPHRLKAARAIRRWTLQHIGASLNSTSEIDALCVAVFLANAKQVVPNMGITLESLLNQQQSLLQELAKHTDGQVAP